MRLCVSSGCEFELQWRRQLLGQAGAQPGHDGLEIGHTPDRDSNFVRPLARVLKSRYSQSFSTMPTSIWWNHLSYHLLVQWGITRGALQEASLPNGAIKKIAASKPAKVS